MRSLPTVSRAAWVAVLGCLLLVAACTGLGAEPAKAAPQLHIGVDLPLTGTEGRAAASALDGIRLYVRQHPSLDGFAVSLVTADDGEKGGPSPSLGAANVGKFIADPNLIAMIGPFDSSVARAEIPVANAASLAMVSPATSSPCLTRDAYLPALLNPARTTITCAEAALPTASSLRPTKVNSYFRLTTTDDLQGPAAADFMVKNLGVYRAAVISDREVYGQGLAAAFSSRLERLGGSVVASLTLDAKTPDATTFLKSAKDAGAQAVYFGGTTQDRGCEVRAAMASIFPSGAATPFLSGDGVADDPACVSAAEGNTDGLYATVPLADATAAPAADALRNAFRNAFGVNAPFGPYSLLGYDAAAVLFAALHHAIGASGGQLPVRGNVISQLSNTSGFAGITGTIGFDAFGDTSNRVLSILEPAADDPSGPWKLVTTVDYSSGLPY